MTMKKKGGTYNREGGDLLLLMNVTAGESIRHGGQSSRSFKTIVGGVLRRPIIIQP